MGPSHMHTLTLSFTLTGTNTPSDSMTGTYCNWIMSQDSWQNFLLISLSPVSSPLSSPLYSFLFLLYSSLSSSPLFFIFPLVLILLFALSSLSFLSCVFQLPLVSERLLPRLTKTNTGCTKSMGKTFSSGVRAGPQICF